MREVFQVNSAIVIFQIIYSYRRIAANQYQTVPNDEKIHQIIDKTQETKKHTCHEQTYHDHGEQTDTG